MILILMNRRGFNKLENMSQDGLPITSQNLENGFIFQEYLEEHHKDDIVRILLQDDSSKHFSVVVNTLEFIESTDDQVSHLLLAEPNLMLPLFDQSFKKALIAVMQRHESREFMVFKPNLHVRLSNLPICPELRRDVLPKSSDIRSFLAITGL